DYSEQQGQFSVYSSKCALSFHDSLLLYTLNHDQSFDELRIKNEIVQHMIRNRDARGLFYWGLLNDKFYLNEFIKTKIDQNKPDSEFLYKETVEISKPVPFSIKGTLTPEYYTKLFESDYYQSSVSDLKLQAILLVTNKDNVGQAIKTAEKIVREHEENSNEPYKQNRKKSNQSKVYGKKGTLHQMICQSQDVESNFKSTSLFSKSLVFSTLFLLKARNSDSIETLLFYIRAGYSQILLEECLLRAMELFWEHEVLPNGPHSCSFLTDDTEECKGQHSCVRYVPFYDKYLFYEYDQDSCTYKLFLSETHAFERNDTHKRHSKSSSLSSNTVDDLNALFGAHFLVLLQSHPSWQVAPFFTQFIYKISHKKNKTKTDSPKTTIRTSRQSSLTTVSVYPNSYNTISTEKILFSLLSYMIDCNPWYCAYYGYVYCNKSRDMTEILKTGGDLTSKGTTKNQMYDYSEERFHNKDTITNNKIMKGLKVDASNPTYLFLNHAQIFFTVQAFTQVLLKIGKNGNENITTDEYPELARFKIPIPITSDHCYTQNKDNYVSDISKLKNITNDSIDAAFSNSSFANQTVTLVTISSFSKNISVFKSLQAPKRLIYTDQQGKCRSFMIKCNDELRKDSRMIGMYKLFYKIEEKRDYNRINEMVYRKCKNIWDNVEEKQESVVRPNRESAIRPNRESAIRQNRESAIRSNSESAIRSNRESAIRSNRESAIRQNRESAICSNSESTIRSNEQIPNTVATKIKADNENSEKCLDCASDLTICSHSVDFLNSNKNNCSCQSDNISILDQNVYDSFENGINGSLLRHYVVVPLGDKFGMIEWIGNLATIKSIVWEGNKRTIFNAWKKYKKKIEYKEFLKYEKETQSLLKYWFREKYRNTKEYYKNKYNYLNSLAITSAYGYFLGLGDRHLENINILTDSGTIVHIDLNLLFSKGKQLSVPEKVEFRMSKNIVDNLLIGKENGLFKVRFQEMINLIKKKQSMVEAHLLSFVYDPINELARPKQTITSLIKKLDKNVDELIKENTDKKNLSAMYVGWMPFL
ncbi:protein kinase of the PI-3 kinase family, partial [Pseudoloma neurophilia]